MELLQYVDSEQREYVYSTVLIPIRNEQKIIEGVLEVVVILCISSLTKDFTDKQVSM